MIGLVSKGRAPKGAFRGNEPGLQARALAGQDPETPAPQTRTTGPGHRSRTQDLAGNHRGPGWLAAVPDGPGSRAITMTRQSNTAETLAPRHDHRNRTAYLVTPLQMRPDTPTGRPHRKEKRRA